MADHEYKHQDNCLGLKDAASCDKKGCEWDATDELKHHEYLAGSSLLCWRFSVWETWVDPGCCHGNIGLALG